MGLGGRTTKLLTYLFCFKQTDFNQCAAVMWHLTKVPQAQCHQLEGGRLGRGGWILCLLQGSFIISFWKMRTEWAPHGNLLSFLMSFTKEMLWIDLDNMTALWMRPENCLQKCFKFKRKQKHANIMKTISSCALKAIRVEIILCLRPWLCHHKIIHSSWR